MELAPTNFPYQALGSQSFRLLKVDHKADTNNAWQLDEYPLGSEHCPKFAAVSYVWGEKIWDNVITLNGREFRVLNSIYPLLEVIRSNEVLKSYDWFWIDSICINNNDVSERASQVQLMDRIYKNSTITIIWLGPQTTGSDQGIEFFLTLATWRDRLDNIWKTQNIRQLPNDLDDSERWEALADILRRPWWRRAWTTQELILPDNVVFFYGTKHISRPQFHKGIYSIFLCNPRENLISRNDRNTPWNRRRILQWRDEGADQQHPIELSLIALIAFTGDYFSWDPKDRIYAYLGLINDQDKGLVGTPTYDSGVSAGMVYANVVKSFIQIYKSLDIICFATLFNELNQLPEKNRTTVTVPSWIPNWNIRVHVFVTPLLVSQSGVSYIGNFRPIPSRTNTEDPALYTAAGDRVPQCSISDDLETIKCKGIILDFIDGLGTTGVKPINSERDQYDLGLIPSAQPQNQSVANFLDPGQINERRHSLLDEIIRCMVLDRQDRYLSIHTPLDRFRAEFAYLITSKNINANSSAYQQFYSWIEDNQALLCRGFRLEELFESARLITVPPEFSLPEQSEDSLPSRLNDTTNPNKMRKRLIVTEQGFVGMAPWQARQGDIICVLYGCHVPVLLRRHGEGCKFIGECYVDGFMKGEILCQPESQDVDFILQ